MKSLVLIVAAGICGDSICALAQNWPLEGTLQLMTPRSVQFTGGRTIVDVVETRLYFRRDGAVFVGFGPGTGVLLAPGVQTGSYENAERHQDYTAILEGEMSALHVQIQVTDCQASSQCLHADYVYNVRIGGGACSVADGRFDAWSDAGYAADHSVVAVRGGIQTCYLRPGRHLF